MHESVWMKNIVVAENTFEGTMNGRRIYYLLQLGNSRQHVISHVEFMVIVPLDLVVDALVNGGFDTAIQHQHTIAYKLPDLFVV